MKRMVIAVACLWAALAPAQAQMDSREAIALQNQILQLRRDLQSVQQGQGSSLRSEPDRPLPRADNGLTAQLLDRVSTLEDQMRQMRGDIDRVAEQQRRQSEDLNKQIADLSFALQNAGSRPPPSAGPAPSEASRIPPPIPVPTPVPTAQAPRTPELAMQEGNAALARRDYAGAEAAAREVLAKRGTPRAGDAQYLLAQAELGGRNYQQAAPDFYDAYNRQRTGPRAPNALLGVANALIGIGDKPSACEALAKLRAEFPSPPNDVREGEVGARQRAGCR